MYLFQRIPEITIFRTTSFGLLVVTAYFLLRSRQYHHSSCHQFNNIALVGGLVFSELTEYSEQLHSYIHTTIFFRTTSILVLQWAQRPALNNYTCQWPWQGRYLSIVETSKLGYLNESSKKASIEPTSSWMFCKRNISTSSFTTIDALSVNFI